MEINWTFSDFIKKIAITKGILTQEQLINILFLGDARSPEGVDSSVASKYINGKAPIKKAFLEEIKNCSHEELCERMDCVFIVGETAERILRFYRTGELYLSGPEYAKYQKLYSENKSCELVAQAFCYALFRKEKDSSIEEINIEPFSLPDEYDNYIEELNETIKRSNGKIRVYMGDEMNFDDVYVLPSLTDKEERDFIEKITVTTFGGKPSRRSRYILRVPGSYYNHLEKVDVIFSGKEFLKEFDRFLRNDQLSLTKSNHPIRITSRKNDLYDNVKELNTKPASEDAIISNAAWSDTADYSSSQRHLTNCFKNTGGFTDEKIRGKASLIEKQSSETEIAEAPVEEAYPNDDQNNEESHKSKEKLMRRQQKIQKLFAQGNIVYVVGGAGFGKSLFLKMLCINPQIIDGYSDQPLLVLYGDIKRMIDKDGIPLPMTDYLERCLIAGTMKKSEQVAPNFLENCLRAGRCLILLDALDEVGSDYRSQVHELILSFFTKAYPKNKICITSRDRGFIPQDKARCFYIDPIDIDDIAEYIDNFILHNRFDASSKSGFLEQASVLIQNGFIQGFLTLSLLLAIYKEDQQLPTSKRLLYERCFEFIANQREKTKRLMRYSKTVEAYDWTTLETLMSEATFSEFAKLGAPNNQNIAEPRIKSTIYDLYGWQFKSQTLCNIKTEQFLQYCTERTEVFIPSNQTNSEYRFFHRAFFDYFYAKYLEMQSQDVTHILNCLYSLDIDSEIVELLISMYSFRKPRFVKPLFTKAFTRLKDQATAAKPNPKTLDTLVVMLGAVTSTEYKEQFIHLLYRYRNELKNMKSTTSWNTIQEIAENCPECVINECGKNAAQLKKEAQEEVTNLLHSAFVFANTWVADVSKLPMIPQKNRDSEANTLHLKLLIPSKETSGNHLSSVKLICLSPNGRQIITSVYLGLSNADSIKKATGAYTKKAKKVSELVSKVRELPTPFQESFITWIMLNA